MQTIRVGGSPQAIAVGNGRVWVSVQTALFGPGIRAGVLRVASIGIDSLDPAIGYTFDSWAIEYVTCANLLNYPDRPAPAGSRLVPEVAAAMPARSADGKSYTFTIRPGFRFSPPSNAPVTAQTFKFSIERALSPKIPDGPGRSFAADIVGVQAYEAGKAKHISGISVRGNTLTVRLTGVSPDIVSRLAQPLFCPVPLGTPVEATGVNTVSSAGPYYVAAYRPEQGAVLKRNPNYHGPRPHVFDEIDYETSTGSAQNVREIEAGTSDFAVVSDLPADAAREPRRPLRPRQPGRPSRQAAVLRQSTARLRVSRPQHEPTALRKRGPAQGGQLRARPAGNRVTNLRPSRPTSISLPGIPGFRDTHVYPLTPDLAQAKRLARGHGGRAVLYAGVESFDREMAQLIKAELAPIGINVQIKSFPGFAVGHRIGRRGEPFDMALVSWYVAYPDPSNILNYLFDGRSIRATANSNHVLFRRSGLQPQARRRSTAQRPAALRRLPGARSRPPAQRGTGSTALQLRRVGVLLRPHRLPGLPARLPDRPRRALPQAVSLSAILTPLGSLQFDDLALAPRTSIQAEANRSGPGRSRTSARRFEVGPVDLGLSRLIWVFEAVALKPLTRVIDLG